MKEYKEFTFGWLIFACVLPSQGVIIYLFMNNLGDHPIEKLGFVMLTLLFILICLLFYGLTTKIAKGMITISFGIGLIRKRIQLSRIRTIEVVENPWYYGWGIRFIPNGMLYNIAGSNGVELKFKDTGRILRIGTRDSAVLKREIESRLK